MSYAQQATSGMLWLAIGTVVAKLSSFLSLIVLGWYLNAEDFALYALAYSSSVIFIALRNGGIQQLIIQRGKYSFSVAINTYTRYAFLFNFLGMFLILMLSPFVVAIYDDNALYLLLIIIAISLPMGTAGLLYRAKLSIDLRFSDVARFDAYSSIVRHSSAAFLAVLGFGVNSFILPLLIVALFEGVYGKYKTQFKLLKRKKLSMYAFKRILNRSRWMIVTGIAISLSLQGDYLIIGLFESKDIVGLYFFGFQVTIAISIVISQGMQSVIMPVMSKIKNDPKRQSDAYMKMLFILLMVMSLVACEMYFLAAYPIDFIWQGKWNEAIPVVQLMSLSLITTVLVPLGKSILESRARWKTVSYLMVIDAFGTILSALIGAYIGGLLAIAIAVSLFRFSYGVFYALYIAGVLKLKYALVLKVIVYSVFSGLGSLYIVMSVNSFYVLDDKLLQLFAGSMLLAVIYIIFLVTTQFSNFMLTLNYMKSLVSK